MSSEFMGVLWNIKRLQWIGRGLYAELGKQFVDIPRVDLGKRPETLAGEVRSSFGFSIDLQRTIRIEKEQFDLLRSQIEQFGVLVAKQPFPLQDARAFSIMHEEPFAIVVNSRDGGLSHASKTFSLMHEFCHVLLRRDGLCNDFTASKLSIERFCNRFAAEFLMPARNAAALTENFSLNEIEGTIKALRKTFKISAAMALTYLVQRHLVSKEYYLEEMERLEEEGRQESKKKKHIKITPENRVLYSLGQHFVSLIVEARRQHYIAEDKAAEYLNLRGTSYNNLENGF